MSPSSRGLGHHPFTVSTGVRIPLGTPGFRRLDSFIVETCSGNKHQAGAALRGPRYLG